MMKMFFFFLSLNFLAILIEVKLFILVIGGMVLMILTLVFQNFLNFYWVSVNYFFGVDFLSLNLIILSIWILYLSVLANSDFLMNIYGKNFLSLIILLVNILIFCFCSLNLMVFYIMFEFSLIPVMFIIMGWGFQIDRIQASVYMLFYTLFASLPLLVILMFLYYNSMTLMINVLTMMKLNYLDFNLMVYLMMVLAFFVKMPMYCVHLWLPKAHVEAPVSGSMILAGIMLKLGSYGFYRFLMIFKMMFLKFNYFFIIFSLLGGLVSSLVCLNQSDMKIIVAYSSVVHMSVLMSGMMTMFCMGMIGSLFLMISHGFCSCGMFYLLNLNYVRVKSRTLFVNKGLINILPSLTLWWFLMFSSNFSAPPSLNLFGEIFLINSLIQWSVLVLFIVALISFFSTCYSIFLYAFTQYGDMNFLFMNFKSISCREYIISVLLWLPLNFFFLGLNFMF